MFERPGYKSNNTTHLIINHPQTVSSRIHTQPFHISIILKQSSQGTHSATDVQNQLLTRTRRETISDQEKAKQPQTTIPQDMDQDSDSDVYPDLRHLGSLDPTIAKQNEESYKKIQSKVAKEVLDSSTISTFMALPFSQRNKKLKEKLVTKGWIIAWDEYLDTYPLGAADELIERDAEICLGDATLVEEARRVFWRENAFHVMDAMVPLWELLARSGVKENLVKIKIDVQVPRDDEDREDTWKGIRELEECTELKWVLIDVEGVGAEVDRCVEDMRELFEQVAVKCQPEKGVHVVKVKRYPGSGGTETLRSVVPGAWERYDGDNDGRGIHEVLAEKDSRLEADEKLRKDQDDHGL